MTGHHCDASPVLYQAIDAAELPAGTYDTGLLVEGILEFLAGAGLAIVPADRVLATDAETAAADLAQLKLDVRALAESIYDQTMAREYDRSRLAPIMDRYAT